MKNFITFKREVTVSDLLLLLGVGLVMATDHYRIGRLEDDTRILSANIERTNANVDRMSASCHEAAGAVAELAQFIHARDGQPPIKY